jgi:membrane protein
VDAVLTWIWLSVVIVLLGAELNAEMEHQTARDSTEEMPKPLGSRGAKLADHVGASHAWLRPVDVSDT